MGYLSSLKLFKRTRNSSKIYTAHQQLPTMVTMVTMKLLTLLLIQACGLVSAQVVSPYPVSDCGGGIAGTELQCPDQPGCCSGGAMCCAGGCCPLSAICVNSGTSNEQCCDLSDKSLCGAAVTDSVRFLSRIRIFYIQRVPLSVQGLISITSSLLRAQLPPASTHQSSASGLTVIGTVPGTLYAITQAAAASVEELRETIAMDRQRRLQ
jgi:hypothetical protein